MDSLIDYAERHVLLEDLLNWAKEKNEKMYKLHYADQEEEQAPTRSQPDDDWMLIKRLILAAIVCVIIGFVAGTCVARPGSDEVQRFELSIYPRPPGEVPAWQAYPEARNYVLQLSDDRARTGNSSLKLTVSMGAYQFPTATQEYAGFGVNLEDYTLFADKEVVACSAWIWVPELQMGSAMKAKAFAYTYDDRGYYLASVSRETDLVARQWTKVTVSIGYAVDYGHPEQGPQLSLAASDRRVKALYVNVFDDQMPYLGDIYLDEVVCYADTPTALGPPIPPSSQ